MHYPTYGQQQGGQSAGDFRRRLRADGLLSSSGGADNKKSPLGNTISSFSKMAENVTPRFNAILGVKVEFVSAQVMLWPHGAENQACLHSCGSPTLGLNDWRRDWPTAVPFGKVCSGVEEATLAEGSMDLHFSS